MDLYKDENLRITLDTHHLYISVPGYITDLEIFRESNLINGEIWIIKILDKRYGVFFDDLFPQLEQGMVTNLLRRHKNVLKIPLGRTYVLSEQIFYMIKEPYTRSKNLTLYWTNKLKLNLN